MYFYVRTGLGMRFLSKLRIELTAFSLTTSSHQQLKVHQESVANCGMTQFVINNSNLVVVRKVNSGEDMAVHSDFPAKRDVRRLGSHRLSGSLTSTTDADIDSPE